MNTFLWSDRALSRIKFFGWLLTLSRIHMRDVLLYKTILTADEVGCPCCVLVPDIAYHVSFVCPFMVQFWRCLGMSSEGASVMALHLADASTTAFVLLY
ncbi:hypothetical protein D1007_53594 [Hordeum vulgare]|nr:hypothetical protein D1007_53594 [Hordeum vulgare]